jgi:DNA-binding transcriptional MerR regulator
MARPGPVSVPHVDDIVRTLRRGQRELARNPKGAIEAAVRQLLAPKASQPVGEASATSRNSYRIDDLARSSGVTVRNIRAYQERSLLHPPIRRGRVALFDDTHLARLKVITSMLSRGYTSDHISEMLSAWQSGMDLGQVLGIESALLSGDAHDEPRTVSKPTAVEFAGGVEDLDLLITAGLAEPAGARVRLLRPGLTKAFAEMRGYGMTTAQLIDVYRAVAPEVDRITDILVTAGAQHVAHLFEVGAAPTTGDLENLVEMLQRFRTLAMTSVTATLTESIDHTVEALLADYLAQFVAKTSDAV